MIGLCGFNPRPPHGGRHNPALRINRLSEVSIHAPRTGGDQPRWPSPPAPCTFQSTPPARGATMLDRYCLNKYKMFQSTPPARGATLSHGVFSSVRSRFQSTPPARGATSVAWPSLITLVRRFNPRPPHGGRRGDERQVNIW